MVRNSQLTNDFELALNLIKFALGRGFEMRLIRQCVDEAELPDD